MHIAVTSTLQALFEVNDEISIPDSQNSFFTERLSSGIYTLRNEFGVEINMHGVYCDLRNKRKSYEKYRLKRSKKNLQKVQNILKTHSTKKPLKKADR
ncbi:MAG: hypothetical protein QG567_1358 [Campylobacterota bacterium]|nr:hypothetical protein [Campylobacterota bacterium]